MVAIFWTQKAIVSPYLPQGVCSGRVFVFVECVQWVERAWTYQMEKEDGMLGQVIKCVAHGVIQKSPAFMSKQCIPCIIHIPTALKNGAGNTANSRVQLTYWLDICGWCGKMQSPCYRSCPSQTMLGQDHPLICSWALSLPVKWWKIIEMRGWQRKTKTQRNNLHFFY